MAYPPPILETSSNTAVARDDAARETFDVDDPPRAVDAVVALRTTCDDAARDDVAPPVFTVPPMRVDDVAPGLRTTVLAAVRAVVVSGRPVAGAVWRAVPRPVGITVRVAAERWTVALGMVVPDVDPKR